MLTINQLIGFGVMRNLLDITVTDDGDHAVSSGAGTSAHTYSAKTSTGPLTALLISYGDNVANSISSITWNGVAMTIAVQVGNSAGQFPGAAIALIDGAQNGNIVINFATACDTSYVTVVSLANVDSITPVATDSETSTGGTADLDTLASPGVGGVRLAMYNNDASATAVSWVNATGLSDLANVAGSGYRHSAAYDTGDDATSITPSAAASHDAIVGVSLR